MFWAWLISVSKPPLASIYDLETREATPQAESVFSITVSSGGIRLEQQRLHEILVASRWNCIIDLSSRGLISGIGDAEAMKRRTVSLKCQLLLIPSAAGSDGREAGHAK